MAAQIKSVILAAVGGQGGGLLTEWIVTAAQASGYQAQSISMPGMSQRGGATNLYLEIATSESDDVVFSHYPFPGQVDVVVSQEYLELGRLLQAGFTSDRTTVVGSSHRLYAITEKLPLWGGRREGEALTELGQAFSGAFVVFDALDLARQHGMDELAVNAILLGALAASEALPITRDQYERAIRDTEIGVDANVAGFRIGYEFVASGGHLVARSKKELAASQLVEANAARLSRQQRAEVADVLDEQPEQLVGRLAGPALPRPRLTDHAFHFVAPAGTAAGDCSSEASAEA